MLVTTTNTIEGRTITHYLGIVSGEAILGANIFRDVLANLTDAFGGRAGAYESELKKARETALAELEENASSLGATAVVGVQLDFETIHGRSGNLLMVTATGTAVLLA